MKNLHILVFTALLLVFTGCEGVEREDTYNTDKEKAGRYAYGSVASEKGGFSLFGSRDEDKEARASGIGVNAFLWRAALDALSFMPIASADPFGGTIITNWYAPPSAPHERVKLNVFILSRELRADGVRVSVFRQVKDAAHQWVDAETGAATAGTIEDSILTRARQMRVQQLEQERSARE